MRAYVIKRVFGMIPTLILISGLIFIVIQLPPGDIVTSTLDRMQSQGLEVSAEALSLIHISEPTTPDRRS